MVYWKKCDSITFTPFSIENVWFRYCCCGFLLLLLLLAQLNSVSIVCSYLGCCERHLPVHHFFFWMQMQLAVFMMVRKHGHHGNAAVQNQILCWNESNLLLCVGGKVYFFLPHHYYYYLSPLLLGNENRAISCRWQDYAEICIFYEIFSIMNLFMLLKLVTGWIN